MSFRLDPAQTKFTFFKQKHLQHILGFWQRILFAIF